MPTFTRMIRNGLTVIKSTFMPFFLFPDRFRFWVSVRIVVFKSLRAEFAIALHGQSVNNCNNNKQWEVIELGQLTSHIERKPTKNRDPSRLRWLHLACDKYRVHKLHQGDILVGLRSMCDVNCSSAITSHCSLLIQKTLQASFSFRLQL